MKKTGYYLVTMGCFRNDVDSDYLRSALNNIGLKEVSGPDRAGIIIVNSCGFIAEACEEGIDTILRVDELAGVTGKKKPLLVVGCMSQRYGLGLSGEMPEISGILGVDWSNDLEQAVKTLLDGERFDKEPGAPGYAREGRVVDSSENATLLVRIADGCNRRCSFCSIPGIKGPYHSRRMEEILGEIELFTGENEKEVVLIAQDTTSYGTDLEEKSSIVELARKITEISNVRWLRLLYMMPEGVNEELISEIGSNRKIVNYYDMPLQHVSETVLKRMGRSGNPGYYRELIKSIKNQQPETAFRSTFIVGFPGETESEFEELLDFVENEEFDWIGLFKYSPEEGTRAFESGDLPDPEIVDERYDRILEAQELVEEKKVLEKMGRKIEVVVDSYCEISGYEFVGRSYREAPIVDGCIYLNQVKSGRKGIVPGTFTEALITGQEGLDLVGKI